jgi:hypothetical protein
MCSTQLELATRTINGFNLLRKTHFEVVMLREAVEMLSPPLESRLELCLGILRR